MKSRIMKTKTKSIKITDEFYFIISKLKLENQRLSKSKRTIYYEDILTIALNLLNEKTTNEPNFILDKINNNL